MILVLKIRGEGCAAGKPFPRKILEGLDDMPSTDSSESYHASEEDDHSEYFVDDQRETNGVFQRGDVGRVQNEQIDDEGNIEDFEDDSQADYDSRDGWISESSEELNLLPTKRERRTRACFLLIGVLVWVCTPLILVFSFGPMREAAKYSEEVATVRHRASRRRHCQFRYLICLLKMGRGTLDQVFAAIDSIETASASAKDILVATPLDIETVCPDVEVENLEMSLGVDLSDILTILSQDFTGLHDTVRTEIENISEAVNEIENGIVSFEDSVQNIEGYLWMIPGLLFTCITLVTIAMFGVLMAWREKSGKSVQRIMSWFVLPLLIVVALACWATVVVASVGAMASSGMWVCFQRMVSDSLLTPLPQMPVHTFRILRTLPPNRQFWLLSLFIETKAMIQFMSS